MEEASRLHAEGILGFSGVETSHVGGDIIDTKRGIVMLVFARDSAPACN
jgi:hypothetical protein